MGDIACIVSEDLVLYQVIWPRESGTMVEKEELQAVLDQKLGLIREC